MVLEQLIINCIFNCPSGFAAYVNNTMFIVACIALLPGQIVVLMIYHKAILTYRGFRSISYSASGPFPLYMRPCENVLTTSNCLHLPALRNRPSSRGRPASADLFLTRVNMAISITVPGMLCINTSGELCGPSYVASFCQISFCVVEWVR